MLAFRIQGTCTQKKSVSTVSTMSPIFLLKGTILTRSSDSLQLSKLRLTSKVSVGAKCSTMNKTVHWVGQTQDSINSAVNKLTIIQDKYLCYCHFSM